MQDVNFFVSGQHSWPSISILWLVVWAVWARDMFFLELMYDDASN